MKHRGVIASAHLITSRGLEAIKNNEQSRKRVAD
jgi:hypothetical protein